MSKIEDSLDLTSGDHRQALEWFVDNTGQLTPWPGQLPSGLFLANKAKGIHKPAGWGHALSIRQSLAGPYEDRDVEVRDDGGWRFDYFQEGKDPSRRDDDYTNRALIKNMQDGVPVGVLIQEKKKPDPRYRVLGLAQVTGWAGGYFRLEGFNSQGELKPQVATATDALVEAVGSEPIDLTDARRRINAAIVARQGAGQFRKAALSAFQGRCAVTGCDVLDALEAAHIVPYLGKVTNVIGNTLLLRADIHTLFDRGLLMVCPETLKVLLTDTLKTSTYGNLDGKQVSLPDADPGPWKVSFKQREEMAGG